MPDVRTAPAAPPPAIQREDYRPPEWLVPEIALEFELDAEHTRVRSTLTVERNGTHKLPLKAEVRRAIGKEEGDSVEVRLHERL